VLARWVATSSCLASPSPTSPPFTSTTAATTSTTLGRTIRYHDPNIKRNDTVVLDLRDGKVKDHVKMAIGNKVIVTKGEFHARLLLISVRKLCFALPRAVVAAGCGARGRGGLWPTDCNACICRGCCGLGVGVPAAKAAALALEARRCGAVALAVRTCRLEDSGHTCSANTTQQPSQQQIRRRCHG
jgi:hypothetical protein